MVKNRTGKDWTIEEVENAIYKAITNGERYLGLNTIGSTMPNIVNTVQYIEDNFKNTKVICDSSYSVIYIEFL